ncbi:hypothetical protein L9F63_015588 [Diploptera punctata]|uniref:Uncharacterized protein n=1 Tax=Diploptera punctata TaxID=6984 RepID=A0AAD8EJC6_DIPPU|nr:hypothetical protein L9F63_015588 [Diploptera punctata]
METWKPLIDQSKKTNAFNEPNGKKLTHFHRWFWVPLLICGSLLYILSIHGEVYYRIPVPHTMIPDIPLPERKSGFLVDTPGCRIPDLDPFDPIVREFIKKEKQLNCNKNLPLVVNANLTSLFILKSSFDYLNITDEEELDCCYQPFWRSTEYKNNDMMDNKITFSKNCSSFKSDVRIEDEFVKVICKINNEVVYKNYYAFIPTKQKVEIRCEEAKQNISSRTKDRLSILVVGLDAVSRINFHRQMPKTEKILQKMDAIELLGYNKVADNTFPNLVPVLSGMSEKELQENCWPNGAYFDDCNWIWKNFSAAGYRTVFGEDAVWMGLFTYVKRGFKYQPTDYYIRPYIKAGEDDLGYKKDLNANLCVGSQLSITVLLRYISNFAQTMSGKESFGFFWGASLTHDFLNYPKLGDDIYEKFFSQLMFSGSLNRTLLIFMSDHGIRWGGIRETYQGRLEERLPFVFFNTRRLTTPYDLYSTLSDIIDLELLEQDSIRRRNKNLDKMKTKPRGISLFLPVHMSRTCEDAGIDKHWCTCQRSENLSKDDSIAINMSLILVEHINSLLEPYGVCSKLEFAELKSASIEFPLEHLSTKTKDRGIKDYVLIVRTTPGDAMFEATVRHYQGNNSVGVMGVVSRINTYGSQSACVSDYHMKLYCYCKSLLQLRTNL